MSKEEILKFSNGGITLLDEQLIKRKKEIENAISQISKANKTELKGKLRVSMSNGSVQYYIITAPSDTVGKYIKKENRDVAVSLAEKDYYTRLEKALNKELNVIERLLSLHQDSPESIYDNFIQARKKLVSPLLVSDEEYKSMWLAEPFEAENYLPEKQIYETKRGERVRSKSEMMIADAYYELGIPYRYEAKLMLGNGLYRYPDFTALDIKNRREMYHEHFGMMDQEQYRISSFKKIDQYKEAGIYLGKNLIVTYETEEAPFNIKQIKKLLRMIFM